MHSIDRAFTTLQNPYYGGNIFDEKPIQVTLIEKKHTNKLESQSKSIFRSILGEKKSLTVQLKIILISQQIIRMYFQFHLRK
ncbi:hypothetical protein CPR19092_LGOLGGFK_01035 [Companilactobacillus paralimentarius]|uniref:hypothetical protein n=1 Tax=Companilactobacillus paralimentarius TaxID=83526 RepID=UPI00384C45AC